MPVKKRKLITALEQKGFRKKETPHHTYYSFTDNEEKICRRVRTRISHGGGKDIDDNLLAQMAKQMQLDSRPVLEEFIECTITEESYREILRKKEKMCSIDAFSGYLSMMICTISSSFTI